MANERAFVHVRRARLLVSILTGVCLLVLVFWRLRAHAQPSGIVSGVVVNLDGDRVAGAVVRQQTTTNHTTSVTDGTFALGALPEGITVTVTAWSEGYHPGGADVIPSASGVTITLRRHPAVDNPYQDAIDLPDDAILVTDTVSIPAQQLCIQSDAHNVIVVPINGQSRTHCLEHRGHIFP